MVSGSVYGPLLVHTTFGDLLRLVVAVSATVVVVVVVFVVAVSVRLGLGFWFCLRTSSCTQHFWETWVEIYKIRLYMLFFYK